jgi:hypothetical protein
MTAEASKSVLSREQVRQALAVLQEEQQAHPISPAQRRFFLWYGISVWVFFISLLVWLVVLPTLRSWIKPDLYTWLLVFVICVFFVSLFAVVLLFFLNMKLMFYTWLEFRLALRTKLWQLAVEMRTERRWPRRLMIKIGAFFIAAFCVFFLVAILAVTFFAPWFGIPLIVALLAFFFLRFARRRLDVLRNSDQLVALLTKLDASEGPAGIAHVAIPTGLFKEIGAIEDIHIQRRRAKAIDEFRHSSPGYAVVKSRAMIADIAKLDEASQLRIEARIAELASESPPSEATLEPGGLWRVPVTETRYAIVCRQDQAAHRIELLSLRQSDGTSSTLPIAEAPCG